MQPSSPALTEGTLHSLLRQYDGVGEPLSCTPVSHGLLNRGYRLTTTRGCYFLKHHLDGRASLGRIERQHRATDRLGALGLPVVPVVPGADGRTVTLAEERCFALHPWIEGTHRHGSELTAAQSRALGALLGRVHVRLARVIPTPGTRQADDENGHDSDYEADHRVGHENDHESADPAATYDMIGALLERIRARRRRDSFDELAEHRLTERRELLRRYAGERPDAVPARFTGWVHGDFHPLNLLYAPAGRSPRPVAILDWDRLGVQPRAEEAVRGAAIFFLRPAGTLDLRKVRAFARAYRGGAGASRAELAAAVHRVWWERLNDFWMLRWRYQLRDVRADPQFPAAAALVVWWSSHYDAVRAAFCD
ncbi:phosphotransferase [Streptomyces sp. CA-250714]|uniref:phosphotransferase n=1 Tax=Streptomyces sp. CA-250714 TaxID=3240060 RepID=UPI003D8A4D43